MEAIKEVKDSHINMVFFGHESDEFFKTYQTVAQLSDKYTFLHTAGVCALYMKTNAPGIAVIRSFDERTSIWYGPDDVQQILDWMNELSVPTLFEYTKSFDSVIFEERKPTIVLFTDFNDLGANHLPIRDAFKAAS